MPPRLTAVECETMGARVAEAYHRLTDPAGQMTVVLDTGDHLAPWLTVTEDVYPVGMWPPKPGDIITVTVPRVIAARRYGEPDVTDPSPCAGCGLCCTRQGTPPFTRRGDDRPPPELDWDIQAHAWRYDERLPCLWYDTETKLCRHYEHRPAACRNEVVPGDKHCNGIRDCGGLIPLPTL